MDQDLISVKAELKAWHERFAGCVRARDFAGGSALFAAESRGFGTCTEFTADLDCLRQNQWGPVWSSTHSFHFLPEPFEVILSPDGLLACVFTLWESKGISPDGTDFPRRGRCTTVLRRSEVEAPKWVAVHTHYSKTPGGGI